MFFELYVIKILVKKHKLKTQSMNLGNTPSTSKDNKLSKISPKMMIKAN